MVVENRERAVVGIEPVFLVVFDERRIGREREVAELPVHGREERVGLEVAVFRIVVLRDVVEAISNGLNARDRTDCAVAPIVGAARRRAARRVEHIHRGARIEAAARTAAAIEHVEIRAVDDRIERTRRRQPRRDRPVRPAELRPRFADRVFARAAALPDVLMLVFEGEVDVLGGRPDGGEAHRAILFHALGDVADDRRVPRVVELVVASRNANPERVGDRPTGRRVERRLLVVAVSKRGISFPDVSGLAGDDVDRARRGALPRERGLRSTHDLDALEIEYRSLAQVIAAVVDAVRERGHGLLECFVTGRRADAPDDDGLARERITHEQIRDEKGHVLDVGESAFGDDLAGQRGDRDRYVLETLLAPLRGNEDFFEPLALLCKSAGGWKQQATLSPPTTGDILCISCSPPMDIGHTKLRRVDLASLVSGLIRSVPVSCVLYPY